MSVCVQRNASQLDPYMWALGANKFEIENVKCDGSFSLVEN